MIFLVAVLVTTSCLTDTQPMALSREGQLERLAYKSSRELRNFSSLHWMPSRSSERVVGWKVLQLLQTLLESPVMFHLMTRCAMVLIVIVTMLFIVDSLDTMLALYRLNIKLLWMELR